MRLDFNIKPSDFNAIPGGEAIVVRVSGETSISMGMKVGVNGQQREVLAVDELGEVKTFPKKKQTWRQYALLLKAV